MSFLIDKGLQLLREGPLPKRQPSAEEAKLYADYLNNANAYRHTILSWMAKGVTKKRIQNAGLWIDELLQPNMQSMGGGGTSGGPGGIIPPPLGFSGTSRNQGGAVDRPHVDRVESVNQRVQAVNNEIERSGATSQRAISIIIDSAPNISVGSSSSGGYASSSGQSGPRSAVVIGETKQAEPTGPWADIWPSLPRASRGPGGSGVPLFLDSGWEIGRPRNVPMRDAKNKYADAVRLYGGRMVKQQLLRDLLRGLLALKEDVVDDAKSGSWSAEAFNLVWAKLSYEQRQQLLDTFVDNNFDLSNYSSMATARDALKRNRSAYIASLRLLQRLSPMIELREGILESMEAPGSPGPERHASIEDEINSRLPAIREELKRTDMSPQLIESIISKLSNIAKMYAISIHARGVTVEQAHAIAIASLYQKIREMLDEQTRVEGGTSFAVNRSNAMRVLSSVLRSIPEFVSEFKKGKTMAPEVIRDIIKGGAKLLQGREMGRGARGEEIKSGELRAYEELAEDAMEIGRIVSEGFIEAEPERLPMDIDPAFMNQLEQAGISATEAASSESGTSVGSAFARLSDSIMSSIAEQTVSGRVTIRIGNVFQMYERAKEAAAGKSRGKKRDEYTPEEKKARDAARFEELKKLKAEREAKQAADAKVTAGARRAAERDIEMEAKEEQRRIERERAEWKETDEPDEKHDPEQPGGGPPPGPPGPPGPGGGDQAIEMKMPDGRRVYFRTTLARCIELMRKIAKFAGVAATAVGTGLLTRRWINKSMEDLKEGKEVIIDINEDDELKPKKEPPMKEPERNIDQVAQPSGDPGMDTRTYEPSADGKPKLFPTNSTALNYYHAPEPIPAGKRQTVYKVVSPELAPPPVAKYNPAKDVTGKYDMEDPETARLASERPEIGDKMMDFNETADAYNTSKANGDNETAKKLYKDLRRDMTEIDNEVKIVNARSGLDAYDIRNQKWDYEAETPSGKRVTLLANKTMTERTKALGLDDNIKKLNAAADELNEYAYEDTLTPSMEERKRKAQMIYDTEKANITKVEAKPSFAAGTNLPRLIEEEYPKRVQELAKMAFDNKPIQLSDRDISLLERYPSIGVPVLEYADFKERFPDPNTHVSTSIQDKLDAVKSAGFKLKPSEIPFAEGQHEYPPIVKDLIDRIAGSSPGEVVTVTDEERQAISRFPDLEEYVMGYEANAKKLSRPARGTMGLRRYDAVTPDIAATTESINRFKDLKDSGYKGRELISASVGEVQDKLAQDSMELRTVSYNLSRAIEMRAPRSVVESLYREQTRLRQRVADERKDISARGSYLADISREAGPRNEEERKMLRRLQNVEGEFQGNQDALFEYNDAESRIVYGGMSNAQRYQARLDLLKAIATKYGMAGVYEAALAKDVERIDEDDTIVTLPDNPEAIKDQGEGTERADFIDPDEQLLFLSTRAEEAAERRRWDEYSYVAPGFGLGGPRRNTLQRANLEMERKRYSHKLPPQKKVMPRPIELRGSVSRQMPMIPIHENDYELVNFEDAYHNDYQEGRRIIWTDPFLDSGSRKTWESARSIYQPERAAFSYSWDVNTPAGRHMVPIGEVSKPHEYYGTNKRFYQTNGPSPGYQNEANRFPRGGEMTMITTARSGAEDLQVPRGIRDPLGALRVGAFSTRS